MAPRQIFLAAMAALLAFSADAASVAAKHAPVKSKAAVHHTAPHTAKLVAAAHKPQTVKATPSPNTVVFIKPKAKTAPTNRKVAPKKGAAKPAPKAAAQKAKKTAASPAKKAVASKH